MNPSASTRPGPGPLARPRLAGVLIWYGVLGGAAAWAVHLGVAWSVMELACLSETGLGLNQRGGEPGTAAWTAVVVGTAAPALVTLGALAACWFVHRRLRRATDSGDVDQLALERTRFLLLVGLFLNLLSLAAIVGGGVAMAVLEPC